MARQHFVLVRRIHNICICICITSTTQLLKGGKVARHINDLFLGKSTDGIGEELLLCLKMARFAVWIVVLGHFVACMFYAVGDMGCDYHYPNIDTTGIGTGTGTTSKSTRTSNDPRLQICVPSNSDPHFAPWMVVQWGDNFRR